jgi:hypothetical protein
VDVLINTGCNTTMATYEYPRKKVGVQWLRAHETWAKPEDELFKLYGLDMPLWGNSEWEVDLVREAGIRKDAEVQYCGIPHQEFYPVPTEKNPREIQIGALWSKKPRKRALDIFEVARDPRLAHARWILFGNEPPPRGLFKNMQYIQQPPMEAKRKLYSWCDIWFAPSESEGLHIPPMEAALCGATVIANAVPAAGNKDYCINNATGLQYTDVSHVAGKILHLHDYIGKRCSMTTEMVRLIKNKIGDVPTNAVRMVEKLESHL